MIFSEQKKEKIVDQINEYVENNPIEIYVDYSWEFSPDDVTSILNNVNNMGDIISDIESNYCQYNDGTEYDEYFKEMIETNSQTETYNLLAQFETEYETLILNPNQEQK